MSLGLVVVKLESRPRPDEDFFHLKLIDFGLSTKQTEEDTEAATGKCGTVIYMAPEVFSGNKYSKVNI